MKRDPTKGIAFTKIQSAKPCLANLRGVLKDRVKNRVEVAWRGTNNPEHAGGRGLLLKGFAQLIKKPRILGGGEGLRGEFLGQLDLLIGERAHLLVIDGDDTDQTIFLEHRDRQYGAIAAKISAGAYKRIPLDISGTLSDILDLNYLFRKCCTAKGGFGMGTNQRRASPMFDQCGRRVI